jgi:hypothetical protein
MSRKRTHSSGEESGDAEVTAPKKDVPLPSPSPTSFLASQRYFFFVPLFSLNVT